MLFCVKRTGGHGGPGNYPFHARFHIVCFAEAITVHAANRFLY